MSLIHAPTVRFRPVRTAPAPSPPPEPQRRRQIIALVPAHNEEAGIADTIQALLDQTIRPDRIIVVCDKCTDNTAAVVRTVAVESSWPVECMFTLRNKHKKAGALNQAIAALLPRLDDEDLILVQDADSGLDREFIEHAVSYVDEGYGGVGGVFRGGPGGGFVGHLQRNEYARYARDVSRLGGKCLVITGTAAVFRVGVLREISAARLDGTVPKGDGKGGIYDTTVLTEDNELTFALLHLGYKVISPPECTLVTEVMESWRALWRQRLRWKRGAIENCAQYGLTRITWRYWGRQLLTLFGVLISTAYMGTIIYALTVEDGLHVQPFWMWVTLIFVVERVVTVRYRGWKYMVSAATMYELVLDYFLQACHAKAYLDALFRRAKNW